MTATRSAAIRVLSIDHVVLRVCDLDASLRFYTEVLGCPVERRVESLGLVQLRAGSALIDLVDLAGPLGKAGGAAPGREGRNVDHVALRIEHFDESALREYLAQHGIEAGEVAARYGAERMGPSLYIQDTDGNTIELKGPPQAG